MHLICISFSSLSDTLSAHTETKASFWRSTWPSSPSLIINLVSLAFRISSTIQHFNKTRIKVAKSVISNLGTSSSHQTKTMRAPRISHTIQRTTMPRPVTTWSRLMWFRARSWRARPPTCLPIISFVCFETTKRSCWRPLVNFIKWDRPSSISMIQAIRIVYSKYLVLALDKLSKPYHRTQWQLHSLISNGRLLIIIAKLEAMKAP